jgi:hypothetical protein
MTEFSIEETGKVCNKCKRELSFNNFYIHRETDTRKSYLMHICKECHNKDRNIRRALKRGDIKGAERLRTELKQLEAKPIKPPFNPIRIYPPVRQSFGECEGTQARARR